MPMSGRAAQFAPFAALDGLDTAIRETARITGRYVELTENEQMELSRIIHRAINLGISVTITHFIPDRKKPGGRYCHKTTRIKEFDGYRRCLVLGDGGNIPLKHICSVHIP